MRLNIRVPSTTPLTPLGVMLAGVADLLIGAEVRVVGASDARDGGGPGVARRPGRSAADPGSRRGCVHRRSLPLQRLPPAAILRLVMSALCAFVTEEGPSDERRSGPAPRPNAAPLAAPPIGGALAFALFLMRRSSSCPRWRVRSRRSSSGSCWDEGLDRARAAQPARALARRRGLPDLRAGRDDAVRRASRGSTSTRRCRRCFGAAPVIQEIALESLRVHVVRAEGDARRLRGRSSAAYNFSDILARLAALPKSPEPPAGAEAAEPPRFSINNIRLDDGAVTFDDRPTGDHHEVTACRSACRSSRRCRCTSTRSSSRG